MLVVILVVWPNKQNNPDGWTESCKVIFIFFLLLSYKGVIMHSIDVLKLLHLKTEGLHVN